MAEYSSGAGTLLVARWSVEERIVVERRAQSRRRHGSVGIGGGSQESYRANLRAPLQGFGGIIAFQPIVRRQPLFSRGNMLM